MGKNGGGSNPDQYGIPQGATDLQDLIEFREMNFAVGCIFKACYRKGHCSHSTELRDAEKMKWFAEREIARLEAKTSNMVTQSDTEERKRKDQESRDAFLEEKMEVVRLCSTCHYNWDEEGERVVDCKAPQCRAHSRWKPLTEKQEQGRAL
jgi:hypothetical protein